MSTFFDNNRELCTFGSKGVLRTGVRISLVLIDDVIYERHLNSLSGPSDKNIK